MTAATQTLKARLRRIAPYFAGTRRGFVLVVIGAVVAALTEPAIPGAAEAAARQRLQQAGSLNLWLMPIAIVGVFLIRGLAGFVAQYGLTWSANRAILALRSAMFARLLDASPALFTRHVGEQPDQHADVRGPDRRDLADPVASGAGQGLARAGRAADLPDLPELAADLVRRRAVPVARLRHAGHEPAPASSLGARARRRPTSWPTWSRRTCWPGAWSACTARRRRRRAVSARSASRCAASRSRRWSRAPR